MDMLGHWEITFRHWLYTGLCVEILRNSWQP